MKASGLLLTSFVLLSACQKADEKEIGLKESIRHDDFLHFAQEVRV